MHKVSIRGRTYQSLTSAARDLGVSVCAVSVAKKKGTLDRVGTGRNTESKPCELGGKRYKSRGAAAKALGVTDWDVCAYLKVKETLGEKEREDAD